MKLHFKKILDDKCWTVSSKETEKKNILPVVFFNLLRFFKFNYTIGIVIRFCNAYLEQGRTDGKTLSVNQLVYNINVFF